MKILGIQRAIQMSPNSVDKDYAILALCVEKLGGGEIVNETMLHSTDLSGVELVLNMGRLSETAEILTALEQQGVVVINPAMSAKSCERFHLMPFLKAKGISVPPQTGDYGYWVKRGEGSVEAQDDIVYCSSRCEVDAIVAQMQNRGIKNTVVEAHIKGDLVKFYGVKNTSFFAYYYPTVEGISKLGHEEINGKPSFYKFDVQQLNQAANHIADLVNTPIYGGDIVVNERGQWTLIDFNDWPSFSRFQVQASDAIVAYICSLLKI